MMLLAKARPWNQFRTFHWDCLGRPSVYLDGR